MTIEHPLFIQANDYSARLTRALVAAMLGEGLLTGFTVAQRGAGANMSVDVSAGKAVITGDDQSDQGNYYVRSTATENVTGFTAPGSNSRIDIVVLQINDPNAGGAAGSNMVITRVAGTAAASPTAPATPSSALLLATIGPILPATTSITTAMITNVATTATLAFDVVDDAQGTRLGTALNTSEALVRRTSDGRIAIGDPTNGNNAATKDYVDGLTAVTTDSSGNLRCSEQGGFVKLWLVGSLSPGAGVVPAGFRPAVNAQALGIATDGTPTSVSISTSGGVSQAFGTALTSMIAHYTAA